MNLLDVAKGSLVTLTTSVRTRRSARTCVRTHDVGDTYRVLGFQGTCVSLSRTTDHEKLITLADYLEVSR